MGKKSQQKKMEERYFGRRQFLLGSGSLLVLPPLISLMPRQVMAQVLQPRIRAMTFVGAFGIDFHQLYPASTIAMTQDPNSLHTYYQSLNTLPQALSRVVDFTHPDLSGLQGKMNLYRGLGLSGGDTSGHNNSVLAGSHSGLRNPTYGESVDVIIARVLNAKAARVRTSSTASGNGKADGFSFSRVGGVRQVSSQIFGDEALFNMLFPGGINTTPPPSGTVGTPKNQLIIDKVYQDLTAILGHKRLSSEDKLRLQEYVDNVQDLQKRIIANNAPPPAGSVSCTKAQVTYQVPAGGKIVVSTDKLYDNYADILTLAVQCDQARVVHMANTAISDTQPDKADPELHHACTLGSNGSADRHAWFLHKVARFAKKLNAKIDPFDPQGKTLLDNSILLWTNELGAWTTTHSVTNIPAITFGSGGGYFKTGMFVDYRIRPFLDAKNNKEEFHLGRPYKQLLISFMQAAGLSRSQYINIGDGNGFGEFKIGVSGGRANAYSIYQSEHNNPLPFVSLKAT